MTTRQKLTLAAEAVAEYPLEAVLEVLELPRSTWYYHQVYPRPTDEVKYSDLRKSLEAVVAEHPAYGYRRVKTELEESHRLVVNHKPLRRLLRLWELALRRVVRRPQPNPLLALIEAAGPRANLVAGLDPLAILPFEVTYDDFTELRYAGGQRQAHFIALVDHASKWVSGWAVSPGPDSQTALLAWQRARTQWQRRGVSSRGMIVHQDQGSAFISYDWVAAVVRKGGARLSYSLNGARGNVYMESFNGHFKPDNESLFLDAETLGQLELVLADRVAYYNERRRHSSLGNVSPATYLRRIGHPGWSSDGGQLG